MLATAGRVYFFSSILTVSAVWDQKSWLAVLSMLVFLPEGEGVFLVRQRAQHQL